MTPVIISKFTKDGGKVEFLPLPTIAFQYYRHEAYNPKFGDFRSCILIAWLFWHISIKLF